MTDIIRAFFKSPPRNEDTDAGEGRLLVGHAAVFNEWTEINSLAEGHFRERLAPGAFRKTLKETRPHVQFNHGLDPYIGDKDIAMPRTVIEDERGLWTESEWINREYAQDIKELVRVGAVDGMSFRFQVVKDTWKEGGKREDPDRDNLKERIIREVRLIEYGPVTWPAYAATSAGVRSGADYAAFLRGPWPNTNTTTSWTFSEDNTTGVIPGPRNPDGLKFTTGAASDDTLLDIRAAHEALVNVRQQRVKRMRVALQRSRQ